jgi:hypothetical protein
MLLHKKARSVLKANMVSEIIVLFPFRDRRAMQTPQTPSDAPAKMLSSSSLVLTNGQAGSLSSRVGETDNSLGKRRAPDDLEASPSRLRSADASAIRPFSAINDTAERIMRTQNPVSLNGASRNINRAEYSGTPITNHSAFTTADTAHMSEDTLHQQTKFLVSASTQPNMAPVWVPFRIFQSAASFLAHMAEECNIHEWDPSAQLNKEMISRWDTTPPAPQAVVAASVKFDWSEFFIRVRQGRDDDWEFVMQELRNSWRVKGDGREGGNQRFLIMVMLHVVS